MSIATFQSERVLTTRWHVTPSTFGLRLGYANWLYHLSTGEPLTLAAIAKAVGRTGPAVGSWFARALPPPDYLDGTPLHEPLASTLGVSKEWLINGHGDAPMPDLWKIWVGARRPETDEFTVPAYKQIAAQLGRRVAEGSQNRPPSAAAKRRKKP